VVRLQDARDRYSETDGLVKWGGGGTGDQISKVSKGWQERADERILTVPSPTPPYRLGE
jgi:hypothetical protein